MTMSSSRPRRPSISIYDYPEHLNPFNDNTTKSPRVHYEGKLSKESKHKFWMFGRNKKKRSNSFSIKSTWNGLFGKRKETPETPEKRSTITTVSTTYKRESYDRPIAPPRLSKDQQEFDEALGTLTRRRKYTLDDNTSRYSSNFTMDGDSARTQDGYPQGTTTSIMSIDLTPKPPARRFGQVSPRPKDKIPPLDFEDKQLKQNDNVTLRDKSEETPIPPLRRFGNRSSQRLNGTTLNLEEDSANQSDDIGMKDENENVPEDYIFKRFSQDAIRRSNLSVNSCASVTSTGSMYGRKKRRAPQPPKRQEQFETSLDDGQSTAETNKTELVPSKIELQITEPINITEIAENIDEMAKKTCKESEENSLREKNKPAEFSTDNITKSITKYEVLCEGSKGCASDVKKKEDSSEGRVARNPDEMSGKVESKTKIDEESNKEQLNIAENSTDDLMDVEYERTSQEKIEIIKDVDDEPDEICLRTRGSTLSRSDSFSVKEEIEKIERQIKELESKNTIKREMEDTCHDDSATSTRLSIQANRWHFFKDMVNEPSELIKLELKKLPCEQKNIPVVRLPEPSLPAPRSPVKVIELHISEPIKHTPELLDEINPIPKPRRHSALSLKDASEIRHSKDRSDNSESHDKRGKSF